MILNGVPLSDFDFKPGCPYGITGQWNAPPRIETTSKNWADENWIEPYIRADEIFYGGRRLTVFGYIPFSTRKYYDLNLFMDNFVNEVELITSKGSFWVTVERFNVVRLCPNDLAEIEIIFYEARPVMWGSLPLVASGGFGINGYSWEDIGVKYVGDGQDDSASRGESKLLEVAVFGKDLRRVRTRNSLGIKVKLIAFGDIAEITGRLAAILTSEGRKTLNLKDGLYREVFLESGFTTTILRTTSNGDYAEINLTLTEVMTISNIAVISDVEQIIANGWDEEIGFIIN